MVKVKICGITSAQDAHQAVQAGCDALGFVFYKKSPRSIEPEKAKAIITELPRGVITIGVFVNARAATVKKIARAVGLDMLQFHGDESPEYCARFKGFKIIKAFRVTKGIDLKKVLRYKVFAYLFDAFSSRKYGGTGKILQWSFLARDIAGIRTPVFLSGGLNEKNVGRAIRCVHPDWVDASSGLEVAPGTKDPARVRRFIRKAKKVALHKRRAR